jgi:hypothetical protein
MTAKHWRKRAREFFEVAVDNQRVLARDGHPITVRPGQAVYESSLIVETAKIAQVIHGAITSSRRHRSQH